VTSGHFSNISKRKGKFYKLNDLQANKEVTPADWAAAEGIREGNSACKFVYSRKDTEPITSFRPPAHIVAMASNLPAPTETEHPCSKAAYAGAHRRDVLQQRNSQQSQPQSYDECLTDSPEPATNRQDRPAATHTPARAAAAGHSPRTTPGSSHKRFVTDDDSTLKAPDKVSNTLAASLLCPVSCICWSAAYAVEPHGYCPVNSCTRHNGTAFVNKGSLISHFAHHVKRSEASKEALQFFVERHKLKTCSICDVPHDEEEEDHFHCSTVAALEEDLCHRVDYTDDDDFFDAITWHTLDTTQFTTAKWISGESVARGLAAFMCEIIERIHYASARPAVMERWLKMLILAPSWILSVSPTRNHRPQGERIRLLRDKQYQLLHAEAVHYTIQWSRHDFSQDDSLRRYVINHVGANQMSKAMRRITSKLTVAEATDSTLEAIRALYPAASLPPRTVSPEDASTTSSQAYDAPTEDEGSGDPDSPPLPPPPPPPPSPSTPPPPPPPPPQTDTTTVLDYDDVTDVDQVVHSDEDGGHTLLDEQQGNEHSDSTQQPRRRKAADRVSSEAVDTAITMSQRHTAPARSGLRLDHIRYMAKVHPQLSASIALLANMAMADHIPTAAASYIWGGTITALMKDSGGIRPIVPVEAIGHVITKAILFQHRGDIAGTFNRIQACMHPAGLEALVCTVQHSMRLNPTFILVCLDLKNAYGNIERSAITDALSELKKLNLSNLFSQLYAQPNSLLYRKDSGPVNVEVTRGVLQGETLSTFFFCVGIQKILCAAQRRAGEDGHIMAFSDDIFILCTPDNVNATTAALAGDLSNIGLQINPTKCTLVTNTDEQAAVLMELGANGQACIPGANILSLESQAITILGVPIGAPRAVQEILDDKSRQNQEDISKLHDIDHKQATMLLLRHCGVNRTNFIIRTQPPSVTKAFAEAHDNTIRGALATILQPSTLTWEAEIQSKLPLKLGGLGLYNARDLSPAAYLGALADSIRLASTIYPTLTAAIKQDILNGASETAREINQLVGYFNNARREQYKRECKELDQLKLPHKPPPKMQTVEGALTATSKEQQSLTKYVHTDNYNVYLENMVKRGRLALLTSLMQPGAANLLTALPSSPQLQLSSAAFRINLCIRLSIDTKTVDKHTTVCPVCRRYVGQHTADPEMHWDYHIETCTLDGGNALRHKDFQTIVRQEAARLGQTSSLAGVVQEGPNLIIDLLFPHLTTKNNRKAVVVDFSICHPMSSNNRPNEPLARATAVEKIKYIKYKGACELNNLDFRPVVIETTGATGRSAKDFFNLLLANTTHTTDTSINNNRLKLMQLIAVTLAKSTANKFMAVEAIHKDEFPSHLYSGPKKYNIPRRF